MGVISLSCDVKQMKKVTSSFKPVNKEVLFIFEPDKLTIWSVDNSNVVLLELTAGKDSFLNYSCDEKKTICVDIENMNKALSRVMEDDILMLFLGDKSNEIRVNIIKREQKKISRNREFMFPILETSMKYKEFKSERENSFKIKSSLWKTAVIDMGISVEDYSGDFYVFVSKDKIKFQAGSKGSGKTKVEYHKSELREVNLKNDLVTVNLGLKYVYDFFRLMQDDLLLDFRLDEKKPLICFFEIADVKLNSLTSSQPFKFKLLIAQVITREEDKICSDDDESGLELGSELDVPVLDNKPVEEEKGLEL